MNFSFIIPAYNVERWLRKTVMSILTDLKKSGSQGEILIVDDCSTDGTLNLANDLAKLHTDVVKVIHCEKNGGVSVARNMGLAAAEGDWIWFVDGDDEIVPGSLKCLMGVVSSRPDAEMITFQHIGKDIDAVLDLKTVGDISIAHIRSDYNLSVSSRAQVRCFSSMYGWMLGWNTVARKSVLAGLRFEPGARVGEDVVFLGQAIFKSKRTIWLDDKLYVYNTRPGSAMHQIGLKWIEACCSSALLQARCIGGYAVDNTVKRVLVRKIKNVFFRLGIMNLSRVSQEELPRAKKMLMDALRDSLIKTGLLSWWQKRLYSSAVLCNSWPIFFTLAYLPWCAKMKLAESGWIRSLYHRLTRR